MCLKKMLETVERASQKSIGLAVMYPLCHGPTYQCHCSIFFPKTILKLLDIVALMLQVTQLYFDQWHWHVIVHNANNNNNKKTSIAP